MNKQTKLPQQNRESKKTFPLNEVNQMKQQKAEVGEVATKHKDEGQKRHTRTP